MRVKHQTQLKQREMQKLEPSVRFGGVLHLEMGTFFRFTPGPAFQLLRQPESSA